MDIGRQVDIIGYGAPGNYCLHGISVVRRW